MSIEEAYTELMKGAQWNAETKRITDERAKAAMLAVLEEVADVLDAGLDDGPPKAVVTYLLSGVRDEINALGAPQRHGEHAEPPQEEGR